MKRRTALATIAAALAAIVIPGQRPNPRSLVFTYTGPVDWKPMAIVVGIARDGNLSTEEVELRGWPEGPLSFEIPDMAEIRSITIPARPDPDAGTFSIGFGALA